MSRLDRRKNRTISIRTYRWAVGATTVLSFLLAYLIWGTMLNSEQAKRIELEAELAQCLYSKKTFYRRLTTKELIYRDTVTIKDTIFIEPGSWR